MGNDISLYEPGVDDDEDILMILKTLELLLFFLEHQQQVLEERIEELEKDINREYRRMNGSIPGRKDKRKSFGDIITGVSDKMFRRMFRMKRESFFKLCWIICDKVGDETFKLENTNGRKRKRTNKATEFHGGEVSGEVKLAIYLRMLSGASYLDVFMIYGVHPSRIYNFS